MSLHNVPVWGACGLLNICTPPIRVLLYPRTQLLLRARSNCCFSDGEAYPKSQMARPRQATRSLDYPPRVERILPPTGMAFCASNDLTLNAE